MPATIQTGICTVGIDIGKNSFHILGLMIAAQSCWARSGRAARSRPASPICPRA